MNTVSKAQAFMAYVDMGDARSINGLFNRLKDQGYAIGRASLIKWKGEEEWDKRLPEVLAARELAQEAVKIHEQAKAVLEEAGATTPAQLHVMAVDPDDIDAFTNREKLESNVEQLAAMSANLIRICNEQIEAMSGREMEPAQLLTFIKAAGETAQAAATVHKAINPVVAAIKGGQGRDADGRLIENTPDDKGPVDQDAILAYVLNPPRMQQQP